ncbi:putative pinoresinol-lariciresinol reductase 3 [Colletotrichum trifolii]|uniref:Putative pinoresinol-lariciresinol reductase 3 n=1 Tax=Colletotrichum trifolii TaxID=5466 RepID=A0A4R8RW36_COLTR|nr:putative pinoresinol-lariciresinol reductase 3 [Colletotrichum trifolii]
MSGQQGRKIAIVGASGNVGGLTLRALLERNMHTITAVGRSGSTATFPEGVMVKKGSYEDEGFLASAFAGQDVVLLALGFASYAAGQEPLIRAAAKAGVEWILPVEFGSDPAPSKLRDSSPILQGKRRFRDLVEELGASWIAIVNNPWYDWSMGAGFWGIDVRNRAARLYDGGSTKFVTTNLPTTGKGIAGVLSLPDAELERYRNRPFYLQSFYVSQRDMLDSIQRATGTTDKDWKIEVLDAAPVVAQSEEAARGGDHGAGLVAFYINHMREGWGGDYSAKVEDLSRIGLEEEDLDETSKRVVSQILGQ